MLLGTTEDSLGDLMLVTWIPRRLWAVTMSLLFRAQPPDRERRRSKKKKTGRDWDGNIYAKKKWNQLPVLGKWSSLDKNFPASLARLTSVWSSSNQSDIAEVPWAFLGMLSPVTDSWYLFSAFPSAGLDADAMSGSDVAFLGHELLVGTKKARYKTTDRNAQVSWHLVKQNYMPWPNYQSLNNQEK